MFRNLVRLLDFGLKSPSLSLFWDSFVEFLVDVLAKLFMHDEVGDDCYLDLAVMPIFLQ